MLLKLTGLVGWSIERILLKSKNGVLVEEQYIRFIVVFKARDVQMLSYSASDRAESVLNKNIYFLQLMV